MKTLTYSKDINRKMINIIYLFPQLRPYIPYIPWKRTHKSSHQSQRPSIDTKTCITYIAEMQKITGLNNEKAPVRPSYSC